MSDSVQPRFCIQRNEDTFVPLIALDELPTLISLRDVPVNVTAQEAQRLSMSLCSRQDGFEPHSGRYYEVDVLGDSSHHEGDSKCHTEAGKAAMKSFVAPDSHSGTSVGPNWRQQQSIQATIDNITSRSNGGHDAEFDVSTLFPKDSGRLGTLGKKVYCTYWIRTGNCNYMQEGCKYLHEIPKDLDTRLAIGIRTPPTWIREDPISPARQAREMRTQSTAIQQDWRRNAPRLTQSEAPGGSKQSNRPNLAPQSPSIAITASAPSRTIYQNPAQARPVSMPQARVLPSFQQGHDHHTPLQQSTAQQHKFSAPVNHGHQQHSQPQFSFPTLDNGSGRGGSPSGPPNLTNANSSYNHQPQFAAPGQSNNQQSASTRIKRSITSSTQSIAGSQPPINEENPFASFLKSIGANERNYTQQNGPKNGLQSPQSGGAGYRILGASNQGRAEQNEPKNGVQTPQTGATGYQILQRSPGQYDNTASQGSNKVQSMNYDNARLPGTLSYGYHGHGNVGPTSSNSSPSPPIPTASTSQGATPPSSSGITVTNNAATSTRDNSPGSTHSLALPAALPAARVQAPGMFHGKNVAAPNTGNPVSSGSSGSSTGSLPPAARVETPLRYDSTPAAIFSTDGPAPTTEQVITKGRGFYKNPFKTMSTTSSTLPQDSPPVMHRRHFIAEGEDPYVPGTIEEPQVKPFQRGSKKHKHGSGKGNGGAKGGNVHGQGDLLG